jgi:hypothetical protein
MGHGAAPTALPMMRKTIMGDNRRKSSARLRDEFTQQLHQQH